MNDKKKIITISREFGSGGRLIGRRLAEKMDVPYYDKGLLDRIAEESGFCKDMMEDAEKKAQNSFLYSLISAMGTAEAGPESLSLNERFFLAQFDTIRKIADEGSCVIVGRCADYILRGIPEATNVFIYAEELSLIHIFPLPKRCRCIPGRISVLQRALSTSRNKFFRFRL